MEVFRASRLSLVIVNYCTPQLSGDCLFSIFENGPGTSRSYSLDEIIVVDNNSRDDSIGYLTEFISENNWVDSVSLIANDKNEGFSSGNNVGVNASSSEYVLLINSDTIIQPGAIQKLVETLDDNPAMGMASPCLEWPDGTPQESCFRFQRPITEFMKSAATGLISKFFNRYEVPFSVSIEKSYPEWTSFACVLIRRKVFEDIGLLDEGFFMYFEDVDFCKRASEAGWNIINNPSAHVVHLRGGSSPVKSHIASKERLPRYFYESRARYYFKHFGHGGLFAANMFWHIGWLVAMTRKIVDRHYQPNVCDKQWQDIWTNFFNPAAAYIHPNNYL